MKNKFAFLSVLMAVSMVCLADGAFADTVLEADSVNQNACVYQNMGVYSDSVQMYAVYEDAVYNCNPGYYVPALAEDCVKCLSNNYCPGGDYTYSETASGIYPCPNGTFARTGMWESAQCGRVLHIGNDVIYLRSARKTTPSVLIDIDNDNTVDFFANLTTDDVPMNSSTERKLKVQYGNTVYSVYDDSVEDVTGASSPIVIGD